METNLFCSTRTGRTILEKTMEDGNVVNTKDEKTVSTSLASLYSERPAKYTANGHDFRGEPSSPPPDRFENYRPAPDSSQDEKYRKRINPLRIHLGKRPFVDNSPPYVSASKKRKPCIVKGSDSSTTLVPRVPKLIPKRVNNNKFHNVTSQLDSSIVDDEECKPVPRLVPKSQLLQFKKSKAEVTPQGNSDCASLMQPMVKFKCRKCCSMSFKTLGKLKEHQLVCRVQSKEPVLSSEPAPSTEPSAGGGGPSRVTRKVYMCSACGTYYENWNLFLHMREAHNRHICLFCLGMFSKAEKLSSHLMNKHNVKELTYENKDEFMSVYNGTMYLMCCACDEICCEKDDFFNHDCNKVIPKPVPVLVSRTGVKPNNVKQTKPSNELSTNCSSSVIKESTKTVSDKKDISEIKPEKTVCQPLKPNTDIEPVNSSTNLIIEDTKQIEKDSSTAHVELISQLNEKHDHVQQTSPNTDISKGLTNGEKSPELSDDTDSADEDNHMVIEEAPTPPPAPVHHPPPEREGGIKLKLSLNNANSPVIINSTVDPTVGQQNQYKPPTRVRRPPKRYEKDTAPDSTIPPRTPTIKMTICDKPDNPFVKTTIFENNQETILKTLLNNNLETVSNVTPESKPDNSIKSTIYDNKIEDDNSLNRVPKLTVRVPKELLDKDSSSDYSSDSDVSDKLTVDENNVTVEEPVELKEESLPQAQKLETETLPEPVQEEEPVPLEEEKVQNNESSLDPVIETKTEPIEQDIKTETPEEQLINVVEPEAEAEPELPVMDLTLDQPLDKYPLKDLLKVFLSTTIYSCIYCNHARKIAVNCQQLALHMVAEHRFRATVDSITAEELMPETISAKVKARAGEQSDVFINLNSYDSAEQSEAIEYDNLFECFQCYFKTGVHKDLCFHNRKMHPKTILCVMCKSNFYSYSELLCHLCPGAYDSEYEIKFRCYLCNINSIPSSLRLMVHLRKIHHTCDVCLELCHNQQQLSNHVWKHKHHLCYRCGIAYRNKRDITNHLFWKHGTESVLCKKCLQKKWPHVYHFCAPPAIFVCEECNLQFTKAVCLKVHKRFHTEEFPHACTEEGCTDKFVSKKLLLKHLTDHRKKLLIEDLNEDNPDDIKKDSEKEPNKENIPIIDLVDDKPTEEAGTSEVKDEKETDLSSKKSKKKKLKEKDALLLDVNLPELNLSESDSDDSDSGTAPTKKEDTIEEKQEVNLEEKENQTKPDSETVDLTDSNIIKDETQNKEVELPKTNTEEKVDPIPTSEGKDTVEEDKPNEQKVLEIWDNFKKYQETVEPTQKPKEKTPPLVPIRKHVCESDHDYCIIPTDLNGDEDIFNLEKKKGKKSPKKKRNGLSSSSSSSSDSDSSCSCGSNCSCSSSSGSSSSSSSDSDSSDQSGTENKKSKSRKKLANRRVSNGSNVDVMGLAETPVLIPEKVEPPVAESDLETEESETDEEFYDENPQRIANKLYQERRNQMLESIPPSDGGSTEEASRPITPVEPNTNLKTEEPASQEKQPPSSSKKRSKKKKRSKNSRKHGPIKINIPKDIIANAETEPVQPQLAPNKITISLQSNTVHLPKTPNSATINPNQNSANSTAENKRASKRRRVPNKFYGYSSDEDSTPTTVATLKPQQPPKLEWRKEDLPSPISTKAKKEIPSTILTNRLYNSFSENLRLTAPIPDPEPPKILMNTEMDSSDSDSSEDGGLDLYGGRESGREGAPLAPSYLNSGTSSLPYPFERPPVRQAREGESVYCYCRCPYDEVSEMIACDAEGCPIEWFHFECVGIMVPPKGKWYCPECRKNQSFSGYR